MAPRLLSDKTLSSLSIFPNAYIRKKFLFGIQTEGLHRQQTGHSPSIPSWNRNPEEERIRIRLDTSIDPSFFIVMVRDVSSSRAYRSIYSALFPPPFYTHFIRVDKLSRPIYRFPRCFSSGSLWAKFAILDTRTISF